MLHPSANCSNGSATAGSDYTAVTNQTVTFAPGDTSKTITVLVTGDTAGENDETFNLNLTVTGTDVVNGSTQVVGTILNDDKGGKGKHLTAASLGSTADATLLTVEQAQPLLQEA